jgi:hypothetical protein
MAPEKCAMTAESIAKALGGHIAGSCWVAPCSTQDDPELSLSISDGDHGKVLARFHAGCERERVIAALRSRDLWTGYIPRLMASSAASLCTYRISASAATITQRSENAAGRIAHRFAALWCASGLDVRDDL